MKKVPSAIERGRKDPMTSVAASIFASPTMPPPIAAADLAIVEGGLLGPFAQAVQIVPAAPAIAMPLAMPLPGAILAPIGLAATALIDPPSPGGNPAADDLLPAPAGAALAVDPVATPPMIAIAAPAAAPPEMAAIPSCVYSIDAGRGAGPGPAPDRPAAAEPAADPLRRAPAAPRPAPPSMPSSTIASTTGPEDRGDACLPDRQPIATSPSADGSAQPPIAVPAAMPTAAPTPRARGKRMSAHGVERDTGAQAVDANPAAALSPPIAAMPNGLAPFPAAAPASMPMRAIRSIGTARPDNEAPATEVPAAAAAIDAAVATAGAAPPPPAPATPAASGDPPHPAPAIQAAAPAMWRIDTVPAARDNTSPAPLAAERHDAVAAGDMPVPDRAPHPGPADTAMAAPPRGFALPAIAAPPHAPAGATMPAAASAPLAPAPPPLITAAPGRIGHETGVVIARHVAGDADAGTIVVRLDPVEMGRIEVTLRFDDRGTLRAVVAADNPVALDLLRRDSADLGRALADAGVRADAQTLRFDTRAGTDAGGQGGQPWQRPQEPRQRAAERDYPAGADHTAAAYQPLRTRGRVDLMA